MVHKFFELTFTPSVKAAQEHYGSRRKYARFEAGLCRSGLKRSRPRTTACENNSTATETRLPMRSY
jgi:hypothetical protein